MRIGGVEKFSTIDYPGHMSLVVFTTGCNYDCWYCQNRGLLGKDAPLVDEREVLSLLEERRGFLEAVVITGGEPTMQKDLGEFMKKCRSMGYKVKLDTNGSSSRVLGQIVSEKLADYVAVDVKTLPDRYESIGAANGREVLGSIQILRMTDTPFEVRTTVLPDMSTMALRAMMRRVGQVPLWALQQYRVPDGAQAPILPLKTAEDLEQVRLGLLDLQPNIEVRAR